MRLSLITLALAASLLPAFTGQTSDDLQQLIKKRDDARAKARVTESRLRDAGVKFDSTAFEAARSERDQDLTEAKTPGEKLVAYERCVAAMKRLERKLEREVTRGLRPIHVLEIARFERLQAEVELAQAAGHLSAAKQDQSIIDSYEQTLVALESERHKLQRKRSTLFVVLRLAHDLKNIELEMATTRAQQIAAHSRYAALLRGLHPATETDQDRAILHTALEKAEADLSKAKATPD